MSETMSPARTARQWWAAMQRPRDGEDQTARPDPGALARLRRAASPLEATQEGQTIALYRRLPHGDTFDAARFERVAVLAGVLAHVREDEGRRRMARMLGGTSPEEAVMSPSRFRRLVAARDARETLRGFREAVALLGGKAPVEDLAAAILEWTHPDRGEARKTRWLYEYHGAGAAAPSPDTETPPDPEQPEAASA